MAVTFRIAKATACSAIVVGNAVWNPGIAFDKCGIDGCLENYPAQPINLPSQDLRVAMGKGVGGRVAG